MFFLFPLPVQLFPPSLFSVPFIFTWLFPSACCITLSQPNGITSEHVSLSLLSATPPLITRKLMKQRTRTTPSSFCFFFFFYQLCLSSLLRRPPFLNIFSPVSALISFSGWIIVLVCFSSSALHLGINLLSFIFQGSLFISVFSSLTSPAVCTSNATCSVFANTCCQQSSHLRVCEGLNAESGSGSVH